MATTLTTPRPQEGVSRTNHPPDLSRETGSPAQSHHQDIRYIIYGFGSSEIESDTESVLSLSGPIGVALTAAERTREKKLRDDPMAIVLGPLFVDCKRCGARIKLSSKSQYDTLHWRTHRARCLKRQHRQPKKPGSEIPSPLSPPPPRKKPSPPSPETPTTPVPSANEKHQSVSVPAVPSSPLPSPSRLSRVRAADTVLEEYLLRSNRKKVRYTSPQPPVHWKDWSWDQLLLPKFVREPDSDQPDLSTGNNVTPSCTDAALPDLPLPRPA